MSAFVIATPDSRYVTTPAADGERKQEEQAVPIFVDRRKANRYLEETGCGEEHRIESLSALQLLRWMIRAHENNVQYLAVDPPHPPHWDGQARPLLIIEQELAGFAEQLTRDVLAIRAAAAEGS